MIARETIIKAQKANQYRTFVLLISNCLSFICDIIISTNWSDKTAQLTPQVGNYRS